MIKYVETYAEQDDRSLDILTAMAGGNPFAFLVLSDHGDGVKVSCSVGGGIVSGAELRKVLQLALDGIPT